MLYKIIFKIQCPFDSLGIRPAAESEIRCVVLPGKSPLFSTVSPCGRCGELSQHLCEQCTNAVYLMFKRGLIPLEFLPASPVRSLPDPIRPCLELLSEPAPPTEQ